MKNFAARSKAKTKPQRREPVDLPSIIPMTERKWIDIEPGDSSLSACETSKKIINHLLRHSQTVQRERDDGIQSRESKNFFGINFHKYSIGLTIVGKYAWQQEEEQKEDISTGLIFQEQLFISELFKDIQDVISLILHYRTM